MTSAAECWRKPRSSSSRESVDMQLLVLFWCVHGLWFGLPGASGNLHPEIINGDEEPQTIRADTGTAASIVTDVPYAALVAADGP
mgnify:CR=1 FL=1